MPNDARADTLAVTVDAVFVGGVGVLGDAPSAIVKDRVDTPAWLGVNGLQDDARGDTRSHGGPERALCHYPSEHYADWRRAYPVAAERFVAGALGENIATRGITEADVCVDDVFTLGGARLQVAQPRQPCWKTDARTGANGLVRRLAGAGRAGWFYRVVAPGPIRAGDALIRVRAADHGLKLADVWALVASSAALTERDRRALSTLVHATTLAPEWRERARRRLG